MFAHFPLFVSMSEKKILVFGAGQIAARRIAALLRYGAVVTAAAPQIREELRELQKQYPRQLFLEERVYRVGEIQNEDADFVLAATNHKEVNAAVCRECHHKEIPVNNASDHTQCDFYFPALVEQEQLVIGVSSMDGDHKKVAQFCARLRRQD